MHGVPGQEGEGGKGEERPLLPLAVEGDSTTETESVQASAGRVKGEVRDRPSHLRLCHLNVTHWGDAVEGILEEPDFDIGLFCHMMDQASIMNGQVLRTCQMELGA